MSEQSPRLLFVDDEPNIRVTLAAILKQRGFDVTAVGTVPEALNLIASRAFDVLLSDLNIGEPGDGFTVVSAMRRTQPGAATFILTGYPAFETALEAIRQQVDDYFVKPADLETLVARIKGRLSGSAPAKRPLGSRRLRYILEDNKREIFGRWLAAAKADEDIHSTRLSDQDLSDHLPLLIDEIIATSGESTLSERGLAAAQRHGRLRFQQGCSIPSIIREARILHDVVSRVVQENLLVADISFLITDIMSVGESVQAFFEESVRSFIHARHALAQAATEPGGRSILLLSADRELSLLRYFALSHAGFAVSRADSRQEALSLLENPFEALVISYSMSSESIVEMCARFRERNPGSPIVGITKGKWEDLKIDADFTVSGIDGPEALLEVLDSALTRERLRRIK